MDALSSKLSPLAGETAVRARSPGLTALAGRIAAQDARSLSALPLRPRGRVKGPESPAEISAVEGSSRLFSGRRIGAPHEGEGGT